jgi:4-hydroxy-tetrahydrodipicolinate synthase
MKKIFSGVGVALVTPFAESGEVDFAALGAVVDSVVEGGVDFLVTLGTTAETPTLSHAERSAVAQFVVERNAGRVPVVIGMGGNNTAKLCKQLQAFDPTGFAGILSVTPYYNKPTQEGLYHHYKAISEASPLPVILYNVPSRTGVNMSAETTLRIARDCPNVCAVKEACGNIRQMEELVAGAPEGFAVLSGDDGMTLPLVSIGGDGVISVVANAFADKFCTIVHTAMQRNVAEATGLWEDFEEVMPMLFEEGNPAGIKAALAVKGVCRGNVRLPLVEASPALYDRMTKAVAKL